MVKEEKCGVAKKGEKSWNVSLRNYWGKSLTFGGEISNFGQFFTKIDQKFLKIFAYFFGYT